MRTILVLASSLLLLISCEQPTLEDEMDEYCECVQDEERGPQNVECLQIMQDISDKYAFDPVASEEIEQRVIECRESQ